jgi:hypothetical protein
MAMNTPITGDKHTDHLWVTEIGSPMVRSG